MLATRKYVPLQFSERHFGQKVGDCCWCDTGLPCPGDLALSQYCWRLQVTYPMIVLPIGHGHGLLHSSSQLLHRPMPGALPWGPQPLQHQRGSLSDSVTGSGGATEGEVDGSLEVNGRLEASERLDLVFLSFFCYCCRPFSCKLEQLLPCSESQLCCVLFFHVPCFSCL